VPLPLATQRLFSLAPLVAANAPFKTPFTFEARDVRLQDGMLYATIKDASNNWVQSCLQLDSVELSIGLVNRYGMLVFEEHSGILDRDGWLADFLEPLPIIGLVVAAVHKAAGNDEHVARALALSGNASIGLVLGMPIGLLFGNPVLGAVVGAAVSTPTGILAKVEISSRLIDDPRLRGQFEEAAVGRYLYETLQNMITAGPTTNFASNVLKQVGPAIGGYMKGIKGTVARGGSRAQPLRRGWR